VASGERAGVAGLTSTCCCLPLPLNASFRAMLFYYPSPLRKWLLIACACVVTVSSGMAEDAGRERLVPGEPVDYGPLAFKPEVWKAKGQSTMLVPWAGSNVVFLTTGSDFDGGLMSGWVRALDGGWALYADLTGRQPAPFKQINGKATVAAVPEFEFTCGAGCGYVGASGIELAMFYRWNYAALKRDPHAIPHYVFYEMGRNFFTFGDRHSCFTTGFAVFMRYVCMDTLKCHDDDRPIRTIIETAEKRIKASGLPFFQMFTNADGLSEKEPRLKDESGQPVQPSDQPVMYSSAMLRLWKENGGNPWLRRFFAALRECPEAPENTREGARQQCWNWYASASVAARRDLSKVFVEEWGLPLSTSTRRALATVDWAQEGLTVGTVTKTANAASAGFFEIQPQQ
jgi:hypothetical protein